MITRVSLQSTPEERFLASVEEIRRTIDALPDATVRLVLADLETARQRVVAELVSLPPEGFDAFRARALEARLRDVMARFVERYQTTVAAPQSIAFGAGQELAARPLVNAGVTFAVPQISRRQLEVAQGFQALLISNAADETIARISTELRMATLRGDALTEVIPRIAGSLDNPGPFGSLATRAEAITRTELGRIQAIATQAGLEEARRFVPDLRKQWRHSGNAGPYRRLGHIEADGQVVGIADRFRVRPAPGQRFEELLYPRDPAASPENTIFCGCTSLPFRDEWRDTLEAARRENQDLLRRRAERNRFEEAA